MKSSKNKAIILLSVLFILVATAIFGLTKIKKVTPQAEPLHTPNTAEPINDIPIKERPFILIKPRADGREVKLLVNRYSDSLSVEYELEYQAGKLLQGAFGKVDLKSEQPPFERNILLGSCSAGGKCSYHEDVSGGTLILRYLNGKTVKLKGEWNFQKMGEQAGKFTSRDAKFTFDVGEKGLPANTFVIVSQTMGLPEPLDGEVVAGPYAISFPEGNSVKTGNILVKMHITSTEENPTLYGWTEDGWIEYKGEIEDKTLTAQVDKIATFFVVTSR